MADAKTAADAAQETALADAKTAADAAQETALADAKTAADAAQETALADAKTAADAAQETALADAKTAADAKLMAANSGLMAALQELDLDPASDTMSVEDQIAANTATLKDALALVEEELVEAMRVKAAEGASDMAKAVLTAIGTNTDLTLTGQPDAPTVTLKASSAGVVTATQLGYTMSSTPPDGITGWRGATLENDGDTTVIYSNIADSVAKKIGNIYGASSGPGEPEHFDLVPEQGAVGTDTEHDIPWSVVKRTDDKSITTDATDGADAKTTFTGTVSGLPGTFTCTVGMCTVPSGDTLEGTGWTFVPNDPNGTIDVADTAYVTFGWWLNATGIGDGYEFDAFASATGMEEARAVDGGELDGSATYKGGAAGKWAILSTTDDSASGGHFTAAATLTANFDVDSTPGTADNDENNVSIGGTITDFMTGDVSRPSWKVTLTAPDATASVPVDGITGKTSWTTGGAVDGIGDWSAVFYGGDQDDQPAAATGEFDAAIGAGEIARISGAFGATKQ